MELDKSSKQEYSKLPIIIAIQGPSSSKKSEIANKLAEFLHYPLIDEDDILTNLESFFPNPPSETSNELPFKILTHITSTQLRLKLQVIINTPLSKHSHFVNLLEVANSTAARLIIIECTSKKVEEIYSNDGPGNVPNLSIDITKPFSIDEFVPLMINAIEFHEKVDLKAPEDEGNQFKGVVPHGEEITPQRLLAREHAHAHEFSFTQDPKISCNKLHCSNCQELISGPTYQCIECEDFILHKSCAETPPKLDIISNLCPFYLEPNPNDYNFPETHKCKYCEHFFLDCVNCLLQTHIKCGFLPTICRYEKDVHPLNFVIMPFWYNYEYKCFECGEYGKFISYKCYNCNVDLHINCAIPTEKTKGANHTTAQRIAEGAPTELKMIGGQPTEAMLQEAYKFRREMIINAIGPGFVEHATD